MAKSLACMLGRHNWTSSTEHGESYTVCSRCGKEPPVLPPDDPRTAKPPVPRGAGVARDLPPNDPEGLTRD